MLAKRSSSSTTCRPGSAGPSRLGLRSLSPTSAITDRVKETIRTHGVTAIIHFAGSIVVPDSVADPLGYYLNNTVKSRGLIAAAVETGVKNFIFSSTAAVYGNPKENPGTRDGDATPDVALRVLQADDRDHARRHLERARLPLRRAPLFQRRRRRPQGPVGPVDAEGDAPHQSRLRDGARQTHHMEVFGTDYPTPDGTCIRDYIHVSDLARAHSVALQYLRAEAHPKSSTAATRRAISVLRGDRGREARLRRRFQGRAVAAARRRPGGDRRGLRQDPRARSAGARVRRLDGSWRRRSPGNSASISSKPSPRRPEAAKMP